MTCSVVLGDNPSVGSINKGTVPADLNDMEINTRGPARLYPYRRETLHAEVNQRTIYRVVAAIISMPTVGFYLPYLLV